MYHQGRARNSRRGGPPRPRQQAGSAIRHPTISTDACAGRWRSGSPTKRLIPPDRTIPEQSAIEASPAARGVFRRPLQRLTDACFSAAAFDLPLIGIAARSGKSEGDWCNTRCGSHTVVRTPAAYHAAVSVVRACRPCVCIIEKGRSSLRLASKRIVIRQKPLTRRQRS